MAENIVSVSHQQTKPIKVLKWKVREGTTVSVGRILLLYCFEGDKDTVQLKLKCTKAGTICKIVAPEGAIVSSGDSLYKLKLCNHPTIMNDMCAECGADLRKDDLEAVASVPMVHAIPDLKVSEEHAKIIGKADSDRLLRDRKLVLLVDLDQTLIHTTNDNIPPNIKDVYHFQLYGPNSPWYHTRLRPGTHQFLENIFSQFELHICTFGTRNYAHTIAMFLDKDQKFFSNRILSRDECFDPTSKKANLKALFPCGDNMVCIIDDREDVWSNALNLIHVKPYHFFQHTGDINAPPGLDKHEEDEVTGVDLKSTTNGDVNFKTKNVEFLNQNGKTEEMETEKEIEKKEELTEEGAESTGNQIETKVGGSINNEDETVVKAKEENGSEDTVETSSSTLVQTVKNEKLHNGDKSDNDKDPKQKDMPVEENNVIEKKNNDLLDVEDSDSYLIYLECILKEIHKAFYEKYDAMESGDVPDLKQVIPAVKSEVLKGTKLCFSGLVPTHVKLEQSKAYLIARSLGAEVSQDLEEDNTHLVAVRPGTAKVNSGKRKKNLQIVTPDWLWCCAERWEHVDEKVFPLNSKGSKNRHPPAHCSSPEHVAAYPTHSNPAARKRTPSGRFMDTINPLMSFSSDDIADMDKEVEDILDDESESSDEELKSSQNETFIPPHDESSDSSTSSSSAESLNSDYPHGYKRNYDEMSANRIEAEVNSEEEELPSTKFRRGETFEVEEWESQDTENSVDAPDEVDDGEWNMMGAALEREFLSND